MSIAARAVVAHEEGVAETFDVGLASEERVMGNGECGTERFT